MVPNGEAAMNVNPSSRIASHCIHFNQLIALDCMKPHKQNDETSTYTKDYFY